MENVERWILHPDLTRPQTHLYLTPDICSEREEKDQTVSAFVCFWNQKYEVGTLKISLVKGENTALNYSSARGAQTLHINGIKIDKLLASWWAIRESSTDSGVYHWSPARMSWEIQSANGLDGVWNVKGTTVSCCVPFAAEATLIWSMRPKRQRGDSDFFLISAAGDEESSLHWGIITRILSSTFWLCQTLLL